MAVAGGPVMIKVLLASFILIADSFKVSDAAAAARTDGHGGGGVELHVDPSTELLVVKRRALRPEDGVVGSSRHGNAKLATEKSASSEPSSEIPLVRQKRIKRDGSAQPQRIVVRLPTLSGESEKPVDIESKPKTLPAAEKPKLKLHKSPPKDPTKQQQAVDVAAGDHRGRSENQLRSPAPPVGNSSRRAPTVAVEKEALRFLGRGRDGELVQQDEDDSAKKKTTTAASKHHYHQPRQQDRAAGRDRNRSSRDVNKNNNERRKQLQAAAVVRRPSRRLAASASAARDVSEHDDDAISGSLQRRPRLRTGSAAMAPAHGRLRQLRQRSRGARDGVKRRRSAVDGGGGRRSSWRRSASRRSAGRGGRHKRRSLVLRDKLTAGDAEMSKKRVAAAADTTSAAKKMWKKVQYSVSNRKRSLSSSQAPNGDVAARLQLLQQQQRAQQKMKKKSEKSAAAAARQLKSSATGRIADRLRALGRQLRNLDESTRSAKVKRSAWRRRHDDDDDVSYLTRSVTRTLVRP